MKSKRFKVILSTLLLILLIINSIFPVFANTEIPITNYCKCSESLLRKINEKNSNLKSEKIKVCIWYKDIDQNKVNKLTEKKINYSIDDCSVITQYPSIDLLESVNTNNSNAMAEMKKYIEDTKEIRTIESNLTHNYIKNHREISKDKYRSKSVQVISELSLNSDNIIFVSEYAPMIIADLTPDEILNASSNSNVEEILSYTSVDTDNFDNFSISSDLSDTNDDLGFYAKKSIGLDNVYKYLGLSGEGVNVGLIEAFIPGPYADKKTGVEENFELDYDKITIVESSKYPIKPDINTFSDFHWHPNNTLRVIAGSKSGIAKNVNLFATNTELANIEELLSYNIDILEINISYLIHERVYSDLKDPNSYSDINVDYGYTYLDKYYDHLVSNHNITTVVAGGNHGSPENDWFYYDTDLSDKEDNSEWKFGARITSPGMANNVITVGGYDCKYTEDKSDDTLKNYSWKNSYEKIKGCEKPDVIMPSNYPAGGTSVASPSMTAVIALMFELKPSLVLYPQVVKAAVLASCHRKVIQTNSQGGQETISQGITERQGAGVPDAWIFASIICQGTYGFGVLRNGVGKDIDIVQPAYDATNMNISLTWIKENAALGNHTDHAQIGEGRSVNLDLDILRNNELISTSQLQVSSTEMCYFPLNNTDNNYRLKIIQASNDNPQYIRYGYAWSIDDMRGSTVGQEGIYYIKNFENNNCLTYNELSSSKVEINNVQSPNLLNINNRWVLKKSNDYFNLLPGSSTEKITLSCSELYDVDLCDTDYSLDIINNSDGTVCILNSSHDKILSCNNQVAVWDDFNDLFGTFEDKQKWYFEKNNYLVGDSNADGKLDSDDITFIQQCISSYDIIPNNIQLFLSDANRDNIVNVRDVTRISMMINNKYLF